VLATALESTAVAAYAFAGWHHAVWPLLLSRLGRTDAGPRDLPPEADLPRIEIIMPAFNEAAYITAKLRNLAGLSYPPHLMKVTVACDGCTDSTAGLAHAEISTSGCGGLDCEIIEHPVNRGKLAVLNEAVAASVADVIVLTDVTAMLPADALLRMAAHYIADATVGAAGGTYRMLSATPGEEAYWRQQIAVKKGEARLGAPLGLHGALWSFRRVAWEPLPEGTINDDFVAPMLMFRRGWRIVYDYTVAAVEAESWDAGTEERRRHRIAAGNVQQLVRLNWLLSPANGGVALAFGSGKALRVLSPFLICLAIVLSEVLSTRSPLMTAASLAAGGIAAAALVAMLTGDRAPRICRVIRYLCAGLAGSAAGTVRYLTGAGRISWGRTQAAAAIASHIPMTVSISKRALDIAMALAGLGATLPFWPLIALAIRLDSPGPVFYGQLRVGVAGPGSTTLFRMVKFRTMRQDAEKLSGATWALKRDPRITAVGNFLRKTRIDEIPQFWNVLRGDMSIVGPRPERPGFYAKLEREIPFFAERTDGIRPGITGFAQVNQGYDTSIDDVRRKVAFDHAYSMRLMSFRDWIFMDGWIAFRTLAVMALGRGQ
jgi:lipopolysaccharide/colanic/teichoic acid biosynthesis glycosyltransferase